MITLGTWKAKSETARAAVAFAIKVQRTVPCALDALVKLTVSQSGVRSIDTASEYGNEEDVGLGIADGLREAGISRELLFITTKLWNDDHGRVEEACKESMKKLNVSYLNAYLMHYPIAGRGETVQPPIADTWREMEKLVDAGLVRHIGVANFSIPKLVKLKESAVKVRAAAGGRADGN